MTSTYIYSVKIDLEIEAIYIHVYEYETRLVPIYIIMNMKLGWFLHVTLSPLPTNDREVLEILLDGRRLSTAVLVEMPESEARLLAEVAVLEGAASTAHPVIVHPLGHGLQNGNCGTVLCV